MSAPSIAVMRQRANWAHRALLRAARDGEDLRAALHREAGQRAAARAPIWTDTLLRWEAITPDGGLTDVGRAILESVMPKEITS